MPSRIFIEKKISAWLQRIDWLWLGAKGIGELRLKSVLIYHSENPRTLPNSVQLLSHVQLFATPWTTARQGFPVHHQLSELIQIHVHRVGDAIQPSHPLSYPSPPAFNLSQNHVFSNESVLCIRWPKYWGSSFIISLSNEHSGLLSFRIDWLDLLAVQGALKSILQHHSSKASIIWHSLFFRLQLSHPYMTTGKTIALTRWTSDGRSNVSAF